EFLSIVGPTGCGKTTLAKLIAAIIDPTTGELLIDDAPIDQYQQVISFVFQQDSCLPWMNVLENVMLSLKIAAKDTMSLDDMQAKVREMIQLVNLEGYETYYPIQLSGGMKQRVAIARAFCLDTEILIMDEPFGQIDVQTRYYMEQELLKIWEKYKRTVIFITNHDEEAITLSDRVIKLTHLPATINQEVTIDIPRPRDILSPEFMRYRQILSTE
ncbi:ATP-binding cassette domain-containing protein, partial [candidate division KSB3 bacterium]|nr:ATP-binding cassette domain-containing protein [candidate division KSB3 bacterium]MBD3325074.1 ATP-binding cassette domain-containing protein [candidate division KSB3 bacterium]